MSKTVSVAGLSIQVQFKTFWEFFIWFWCLVSHDVRLITRCACALGPIPWRYQTALHTDVKRNKSVEQFL